MSLRLACRHFRLDAGSRRAEADSLDIPYKSKLCMTLCHRETSSVQRGTREPAPRTRSRRAPINLRANLALIALAVMASGFQLFGLAALLHAQGPWVVLMMVPVVVLTPTHWGLIHEGIHSQLFASRRWNEAIARTLSIALAVPFETVRFGHLMHHRFTREPYDQPDLHAGAGPLWRARLVYYFRLLGGLYIGELVVPLLAFTPARFASTQFANAVGEGGACGEQIQRHFANFAGDATRRSRTRRDWLITLALYGVAFWYYGAWWPVLAGMMLMRGIWISMADNLPHYDVELDEPGRARNFKAPLFWRVVTMNHHLHLLHHEHPTLPWSALPAYAEQVAELQTDPGQATTMPLRYRASTWYFRAAARQFGGPRRVSDIPRGNP
jgi:fatty acid desaturase